MSAELEIVLAVVGTGVALAALIASQGSAQRREIAELRQEIGNVRERLARMEGIIDIIRTGMQLPRPSEESEHQSVRG